MRQSGINKTEEKQVDRIAAKEVDKGLTNRIRAWKRGA